MGQRRPLCRYRQELRLRAHDRPLAQRRTRAAQADELFLATKDQPNTPRQLIAQLDERLAALQTDYVDLIYLHALGDRDFDLEMRPALSRELRRTADKIRKSGKAKFVGFSSHHQARHLLLQAAAQSGFIDVIMLQNNPWIAADDNVNRALDAFALSAASASSP